MSECPRCGKRVKQHTTDQCIRYLRQELEKLRVAFYAFQRRVSGHGPIDPVTGKNIY
jgi:hypothetical protein